MCNEVSSCSDNHPEMQYYPLAPLNASHSLVNAAPNPPETFNRCLACGTGRYRNCRQIVSKLVGKIGEEAINIQPCIITPNTFCNQLIHKPLRLLFAQL